MSEYTKEEETYLSEAIEKLERENTKLKSQVGALTGVLENENNKLHEKHESMFLAEKERDELRAQLARCVDVVEACRTTRQNHYGRIQNAIVDMCVGAINEKLPKHAHLDAEILRCAEVWDKEWLKSQDIYVEEANHIIGLNIVGETDERWGTFSEAALAKAVRAKKESE